MVINLWTKEDSENVLNELAFAFKEKPRRFFTEHDLHSHLYNVVEQKLDRKGELFAESKDGFQVSLVHHEYPTPFRCDMSKKDFKIAGETERTKEGGLYRRGHYDLVVLNPKFINKFDAVIVAGKNYKRFCEEKEKFDVSPSQWACEIIFGAHVEDGIPINWEENVFQDTKKIIASLSYKVGKANFTISGSVVVFIGIEPNDRVREMEEKIRKFSLKYNFPIKIQTA
jgi:hypothetical protein